MRRATSLCLLAALVPGTACRREAPRAAEAPAAPVPAPDPDRIPDLAGWKSMGAPRPSFAGPHRGAWQRVHLNPTAAQALAEDRFHPWPDGSQAVKAALDAQGKLQGWFWMSKEKGRWMWATAGPDGRVDWRDGEGGACAACHMGRAAAFDGLFQPVFAGKGRLNIPLGPQDRGKE